MSSQTCAQCGNLIDVLCWIPHNVTQPRGLENSQSIVKAGSGSSLMEYVPQNETQNPLENSISILKRPLRFANRCVGTY